MSHIYARYARGTSLPPGAFYLFIFAWLFVETTGFLISDEPLLLLAGYLTTVSQLNLALMIALALARVAAILAVVWRAYHQKELGHARQ